MITNLWIIEKHIELTIEKARSMYEQGMKVDKNKARAIMNLLIIRKNYKALLTRLIF